MINISNIKSVVVSGLKAYVGCEFIRAKQNNKPPTYPYGKYTITTLASANNGTYEEYENNYSRKQVKQIWSISCLSDDESESVNNALKAREWFDYVGREYLKNNGVIVQSITDINNRDNILTVEYEYNNGFDVTFYLFDECVNPSEQVVDVDINGGIISK